MQNKVRLFFEDILHAILLFSDATDVRNGHVVKEQKTRLKRYGLTLAYI